MVPENRGDLFLLRVSRSFLVACTVDETPLLSFTLDFSPQTTSDFVVSLWPLKLRDMTSSLLALDLLASFFPYAWRDGATRSSTSITDRRPRSLEGQMVYSLGR